MKTIAAIKLFIVLIPFLIGMIIDSQMKEDNNEKTRLFNPSEKIVSTETISEDERIRLITKYGGNPNDTRFFKDGDGFKKPKIKTDMAGNPTPNRIEKTGFIKDHVFALIGFFVSFSVFWFFIKNKRGNQANG